MAAASYSASRGSSGCTSSSSRSRSRTSFTHVARVDTPRRQPRGPVRDRLVRVQRRSRARRMVRPLAERCGRAVDYPGKKGTQNQRPHARPPRLRRAGVRPPRRRDERGRSERARLGVRRRPERSARVPALARRRPGSHSRARALRRGRGAPADSRRPRPPPSRQSSRRAPGRARCARTPFTCLRASCPRSGSPER